MLNAILLAYFLVAAQDKGKGPLELEPGDLRPGLVAKYRSLVDKEAILHRVEPKPAFYLGRSSPHPRIPPGPFEVEWVGVIQIKERGAISFSAFVGGELTLTVDGVTVLEGRGPTDTSRLTAKGPLKREPAYYSIAVKYRSLADVPARLQLWWEGDDFAREPLPAWRLGHARNQEIPDVSQEEFLEYGRRQVVEHGCARCHQSAFPSVTEPPPGPSLADVGRRVSKAWLLNWLADPTKVRANAHMPRLFKEDRAGFVERWIIAESLTTHAPKKAGEGGDHRQGRLAFLSLGCATCHDLPETEAESRHGRTRLVGLGDRMSAADLATFLGNPHSRYPDGRMPRLPVTPTEARDIAAYLLLWSKPSELLDHDPPTAKELQDAYRRLGVREQATAAAKLLTEKRCAACHVGLGNTPVRDVPITVSASHGGCLVWAKGVRFGRDKEQTDDMARRSMVIRASVMAYRTDSAKETHPSPFFDRQQKLERAGCVKCHQRDSDRPPAIEEIGSKLGGAFLQEIPYLRTPRLTNPHQKFTRSHLATSVREGVSGLRWSRFSYRMPVFGAEADELVQALAEGDGELPTEADPPAVAVGDPTLGTLHGSRLAGLQGYACASCHVWDGKLLGSPDPVATGPDLTKTSGRIRRDWFDRYLENPLRFHPGTPMPGVFPHGKPALLGAVLNGDAGKQKDALWAYLALGKNAPAPKPPPPVPVTPPAKGEPALVAQIPVRIGEGKPIESICVLTADDDLLVYDLADGSVRGFFVGGQILRNVQGRIRQFIAAGTEVRVTTGPVWILASRKQPTALEFLGYERLSDGALLRWKFHYDKEIFDFEEAIRIVTENGKRRLRREPRPAAISGVHVDLPPAKTAPKWDLAPINFPDDPEGSLERPGYRATAYPRPKTVSGEDRVMPGAVAVRPHDGQVFVASMKTGELFALRDPTGDGKNARFERYGQGLYQDALSMLAEDDGLYVLHRRNLTKIVERDGQAASFERVAALPHGIADSYDMAYGLARDKRGRFVFGYAPYANTSMPGSGGALALEPGKPPVEVAFGMRNPLGWCAGNHGEVFFTDNQGDWVAANKLCHVTPGHYFGWPNRGQPEHTKKPMGKTAVWVPYGWARSINGVAYDSTGGKFGPFAGQFFMAELMYGGAIIRANVEKVNGVYQGACFPFWGKGLLGPVTLAFDPRGKLYVGGITEPGWMAQPDRGALYRIDFTGAVPFEIQSIHARPRGFRVLFTRPMDKATAERAFQIESYRYEYTGAYGSPELDRAAVKIEKVEVAADGKSVELTTSPLVTDRVYLLTATVRSATGEKLVHPTGAYTLNEIPRE